MCLAKKYNLENLITSLMQALFIKLKMLQFFVLKATLEGGRLN